ncbi:hypothetical protein OS122_29605 [Mycolicibacterium mucogenicum]|uniref:hypothetical protein n=1 Tax=Mycolicibacterium mucogenicum TaxID=56689 RepID=UPI00226A1E60|nr:hypothetical protein [Mycolicibacterium mucogenicum]MCX8565042.1 hypothetical protein [Mycolicibacterium mucogenicum]
MKERQNVDPADAGLIGIYLFGQDSRANVHRLLRRKPGRNGREEADPVVGGRRNWPLLLGRVLLVPDTLT